MKSVQHPVARKEIVADRDALHEGIGRPAAASVAATTSVRQRPRTSRSKRRDRIARRRGRGSRAIRRRLGRQHGGVHAAAGESACASNGQADDPQIGFPRRGLAEATTAAANLENALPGTCLQALQDAPILGRLHRRARVSTSSA